MLLSRLFSKKLTKDHQVAIFCIGGFAGDIEDLSLSMKLDKLTESDLLLVNQLLNDLKNPKEQTPSKIVGDYHYDIRIGVAEKSLVKLKSYLKTESFKPIPEQFFCLYEVLEKYTPKMDSDIETDFNPKHE